MKILVSGHRSSVGQELLKYEDVFPLDVDVRNPQEVEMAIKSEKPDVVVHLACISGVDECEDPKNEKRVVETNVRGTFYVAEACSVVGCGMVVLSTDHVFDGIWGNYKENNRPHPKNFYGLTKMAAEGFRQQFKNLKVVRTSRLFSAATLEPSLQKLRAGDVQMQPAFIYRSFMLLSHFAQSMMDYVHRFNAMPQVLHLSGSQSASYYAYMRDVANVFGIDSRLVMPRMKEIPNMSPRPFKAGLNVSLSKRLGFRQYSYLDGLRELA